MIDRECKRRRLPLAPERVAALVGVLALHAGALIYLLAPDHAAWRDRPFDVASARSALIVTLDVRRKTPPAPMKPLVVPRTAHVTPVAHAAPTMHATSPTTVAVPAAAAATMPATRPVPATPRTATAPTPDYVAGAGRLAGPDWHASNTRLPGSAEPVHGAPRFAMADPRTQGLAGAVRLIGRLVGGAVDPHCVDVETWRGMDTAERIAHHVTPDQIEQVAAANGCAPPALRPGSPVYYRGR